MKNLTLLLILASILAFYSCGKRISQEIHPDYLGHWESSSGTESIYISEDISTYEKIDGSFNANAVGRARIKGSERKLKIGIKGFKIDTPPQEQTQDYGDYYDVQYYMVLDGVTFFKW